MLTFHGFADANTVSHIFVFEKNVNRITNQVTENSGLTSLLHLLTVLIDIVSNQTGKSNLG